MINSKDSEIKKIKDEIYKLMQTSKNKESLLDKREKLHNRIVKLENDMNTAIFENHRKKAPDGLGEKITQLKEQLSQYKKNIV